ncbi:ABC-2 type transport system permease protein [Methanofollis sp. W23]|uniref:ABC transporter permease n=1 Tax=Methanofollis sp. W23 TaxID=2817849 RepID=UPI001AE22AEC|nr:ABC transporter permease [Methanofollis sp. W23]MBP2144947.1 ABC-2 type transport system permease protein [Methanofollis sp. W23]
MESRRIFIIAGKEFAETLRGRRFLMVLGIFLIIAFIGTLQGIQSYTADLDHYTQALTMGAESISPLWQVRPTLLDVFYQMGEMVAVLGAVLGIAVGFDLISGEREEKSLKILLSHPVYRDEVITGKALGGMAVLTLSAVTALLITLAVLLLSGHMPLLGEWGLIFLFGAVSLLYLVGCFAIALAMSTVARRSGEALMYSLVCFFFLSLVMPAAGLVVADAIVGEAPERMPAGGDLDDWYDYQERWEAWEHRTELRAAVLSTGQLFSPEQNFHAISQAITQPQKYLIMRGQADDPWYRPDEEPDYGVVLGYLWQNVVALLLIPAIFFGFAYVRFLRIDLR